MGLGDAIMQKGLVRAITERSDESIFFGKARYGDSLLDIFEDVDDLSLVFVEDDKNVSPAFGADGRMWKKLEKDGYSILPLGYHAGSDAWLKLDPLWSRAYYKQIGADPELARKKFGTVARDETRNVALYEKAIEKLGTTEYIVIHDDASRNMTIAPERLRTDVPAIHVDDPAIRSDNITDYLLLIERAQEFHGFDSCFALLADYVFGDDGPKRFAHTTDGKPFIDPEFYEHTIVIDHHAVQRAATFDAASKKPELFKTGLTGMNGEKSM
jgi:hypothetical protein